MENMLAFSLETKILEDREIIFLADGAKNIHNCINSLFNFREDYKTGHSKGYSIYLDWYHLRKKTIELLSMAWISGPNNKNTRDDIRKNVLGYLWNGDHFEANKYLNELPSNVIKNKKRLQDTIEYIDRKKTVITNYNLRHSLNLTISSNKVERENQKLCSKRQKKIGASWSYNGSLGMCQIAVIKENEKCLKTA